MEKEGVIRNGLFDELLQEEKFRSIDNGIARSV